MTNFTPIEQAILTALESGSRTAGELLDYTQCGSYPVLNIALRHLQDERRIEYHFSECCLYYRLRVDVGQSRPSFLAWQRESGYTRFLGLTPKKQ